MESAESAPPSRGVAHRLHSPHRVTALADGVFAIAMTLLALEIRVPESVETEEQFRAAIPELVGGIAVFALAFFITAQYWLGHHRVMSYVHTIDPRGLRLSVLALLGVCALPVAASLLTNWARFPQAVAIAVGIVVVTSLLSVRLYGYLLNPRFAEIDPVERRRILISPMVNIVVYLVTVPLAFLLDAHGVNSAWAATIWFVLAFNRLIADRLARRTTPKTTPKTPTEPSREA